jgi:hypothetical protein
MAPRRYALLLLATLAVAMAAVGAAVWTVDPYAVLHDGLWPGFNALKPEIDRRAELWKAELLARERPQVAILGNSRAEVGFDTGHPAFAGRRVVDAALTGASLAEIERLFQQALRDPALERVVVSIDLDSLTETRIRPTMDQAGIGEDIGRLRRAWGLLKIHLSIDALADAGSTVRRQGAADAPSLPLGEHGDRSELYMARRIAADGGIAVANRAALRDERPLKTPAVARAALTVNLARLQRMVEAACARRLRIDFIVPPVHAELLEFWHRKYGDELVADTLRQPALAVARAAQTCPGGAVGFWSALAYTPVATEPMPDPQAPAATMRYFWEVSHFRRAVGRAVFDGVFGTGPVSAGAAASSAGPAMPVVRLDAANVESQLAALAEGRAAWRAGR